MTATDVRPTRPAKAPSKISTPSAVDGWEDQLAAQWHPLVIFVVHRFFPNNIDSFIEDELKSAANYALLKAIRCFNPHYISPQTGRPVQFNTYAIRAMRQEVGRVLKKHMERASRTPTYSLSSEWDAETESDNSQEHEDADYANMLDEIEEAEYARVELARRMRRLKPVHVAIFKHHLGGFLRSDGEVMPRLTINQLATKYGAKAKHISRIIKKVREDLGLEMLPDWVFEKKNINMQVECTEELSPEHIPGFQLTICDDVKVA